MTVDVNAADAPSPALKVLADPLRWRIVAALAREELCVCHLTEDLGAPQPLISHHLRILREAAIVESERWRYWTYYRLRPGSLGEVAALVGALNEAASAIVAPRRPCC